MNDTEFISRSIELGHAMQTGVAMRMERGNKDTEPKHLRTGIDQLFSQSKALAEILMAKGVCTKEEYYDACIRAQEDEVEMAERLLSEAYGIKVKLA